MTILNHKLTNPDGDQKDLERDLKIAEHNLWVAKTAVEDHEEQME